jgi:DNA-binding MarR family transcriptional regulator
MLINFSPASPQTETTKMSTDADSSNLKPASLACAKQVVETVPMIMRLIRSGVRSQGGTSLPQMRVLGLLSRQPGASVSDVAAHLDVTIPTASALVDRMVKKHLVDRKEDPTERRRVVLTLTAEGKELLENSRARTQSIVAHLLACETPEQLTKISEGLAILADAAQAFQSNKKS